MMVDEHMVGLQPGTIIAGRYEVVKCLGAGSMGLVYACRHRELTGHMVAVKVLFPEVAQDKIAAARFRNEIFASYGVSHPNVVRAYEYIRDGDLVAYTMEYVAGGDLADMLGDPEQVLPVSEVIAVLLQMCSGVQAIHDAGIVHRDLKPENILLTKDRLVKIADFGIARLGHGPRLTEHGGVVGTIDYVSPEYILNSQVDWRSDIYALGILAFEMITGQSPYPSDESVYATMTNRLKHDPAPPSSLRQECPKQLDRIVLKAMARNPEERYQSAAEMYYDLRGLAGASAVSGSYLTVSESSCAQYVGPKLSQPENTGKGNGVPEMDLPVDFEAKSKALPQRHSARVETAGETDDPMAETYVLDAAKNQNSQNKSVSVADDHYPEGFNSGYLSSWEDEQSTPAIQIEGGALNQNRLQRLSQSVQCKHRSFMLDGLTLLFAIIIGVGLGVAALRLIWPDLLSEGNYLQDYDAVIEKIKEWIALWR